MCSKSVTPEERGKLFDNPLSEGMYFSFLYEEELLVQPCN